MGRIESLCEILRHMLEIFPDSDIQHKDLREVLIIVHTIKYFMLTTSIANRK